MKNLLIIILIIGLAVPVFCQQKNLNKTGEVPSAYAEINGTNIQLTDSEIIISANGNNLYSNNLNGKKEIQFSPGKNYFAVSNYAFPKNKSDYFIKTFVFSNTSKLIYTHKLLAPFDLPYPISKINDNGDLVYFNPINFVIKIIKSGSEKDIKLDSNIKPEMERASFLEVSNSNIFVLTSLKALNENKNESNVILYKIDLSNNSIEKKLIDWSIPTCMTLDKKGVVVSGVKFGNSSTTGAILKLENNLNLISKVDRMAEKIFTDNDYYYCKFGSSIFKLDDNLKNVGSFNFDIQDRIEDFKLYKNNIVALIRAGDKHKISKLGKDLKMISEQDLNISSPQTIYFGTSFGNSLLLKLPGKTLLYN